MITRGLCPGLSCSLRHLTKNFLGCDCLLGAFNSYQPPFSDVSCHSNREGLGSTGREKRRPGDRQAELKNQCVAVARDIFRLDVTDILYIGRGRVNKTAICWIGRIGKGKGSFLDNFQHLSHSVERKGD